MYALYGIITAFALNIANIFEMKEISEKRKNYTAIESFLMSTLVGLIIYTVFYLTLKESFTLNKYVFLYIFSWMSCNIIVFTMLSRINLVSLKVLDNLGLPITFLLDLLSGTININKFSAAGYIIITTAVFISIKRDKRLSIKNKESIIGLLLLILSLFLASYSKVATYILRTEYEFSTVSLLFSRSLIGSAVLFAILLSIRGFKPNNIKSNIKSHTKVGTLSVVQQAITVFTLGYIPASYLAIAMQAISYIVVPISKRSKDELVSDVDNKAHYYFIANFIGMLLVTLS